MCIMRSKTLMYTCMCRLEEPLVLLQEPYYSRAVTAGSVRCYHSDFRHFVIVGGARCVLVDTGMSNEEQQPPPHLHVT